MPTSLSLRLREESGASLLEVLLAVTIMAILAGVMGVAINRGMPNDIDRAGQMVDRLVSRARLAALEDQRPVLLDSTGRTFSMHRSSRMSHAGWGQYTVPETIDVRLLSAQEFMEGATARILFLPDGRSSGGRIEMSDRKNRYILEIDPQTSLTRRATP